ncbi:DndE family protein [Tumebacillus flagellatus]|uniref:DNA sulfur modification protein n=1 Tax=Tumebacillus flagellatus TaxID=1157490 RepID=A0A074LUU9_9BACL|nr:DndE family protein [Tumebacillus flagellatus]KEO84704.1 DNA sulfur modification protein [Tumebacillus flagellatus]
MNFRLRTSRKTAELLKDLQTQTNMTPNILARFAVCLSLKYKPKEGDEKNKKLLLTPVKDTSGLEFNRSTLTGQFDYVFKALITQHSGHEISDEEYFPGLFNSHLERGIHLLKNEYQYAGNSEKLITNLLYQTKEVAQ